MPETLHESEQQPKESRLRKFGPAIFWGTVVALPALNLTASYLGYRDTKMQLELAKLKDIATQAS